MTSPSPPNPPPTQALTPTNGARERRGEGTLQELELQESMLVECVQLASQLHRHAESCATVLSAAGSREPSGAACEAAGIRAAPKGSAVTTIGIGLSGVRVVDVLIDGPAFRSEKIEIGDEILSVDGVAVTASTLNSHLIGCDVPQTTVALTVTRKRGGHGGEALRINVAIKRMACAEIAWKRYMFELIGRLLAAAEARGTGEGRSHRSLLHLI